MQKIGLVIKGSALSPFIVFLVLLWMAILPLGLHGSSQLILSSVSIYFVWILLSESWNIVGGYARLLNLGLVAFFGLGAMTAGAAVNVGIPFVSAIVIGGLSGGLFAFVLMPTFRLRTDYFAIATLIIPVILEPLVDYFGHTPSYAIPLSMILPRVQYFYLGLMLAGLSIFGAYFLIRSKIGVALRSMGDDEYASASLGVNVLLYKTIALVVSGFIAAVAGAYYLQTVSLQATVFQQVTFSLFPIFMAIIGGSGTFEGPIIGAVIFGALEYVSPVIFPGSTADELVLSIIVMIVAVLLPKGIMPSLRTHMSKSGAKRTLVIDGE